jgi:hypothetical protein
MSQTRAELDRKISQLEARAKEFKPRALTARYLPEYFVDQVLGGVLTLVGLGLAWGHRRRRIHRRESLRAAMGGYSRW